MGVFGEGGWMGRGCIVCGLTGVLGGEERLCWLMWCLFWGGGRGFKYGMIVDGRVGFGGFCE